MSLTNLVDTASPVGAAVNTFEFEETDRRRSIKARFTDAAFANMSGPIGLMMGAGVRALRERPGPMTTRGVGSTTPQQLALPPIDASDVATNGHDGVTFPAPAAQPGTPSATLEKDRLRNVFRYDGERLRLINARLKPSNQADYMRRLTCVFLYAHELEGRDLVPRADLNTFLKEASVYDGNARKWIANSGDLLRQDDQLGLAVPGREYAVQALNEMFDPNVPETWTLKRRSHGRVSAKAQEEEADSEGAAPRRKGTGGRPSTAGKWVASWKAAALAVNGHEILKGRSNAERGIFGLWAIRRVTNDEAKDVGVASLAEFLFDAFDIKVDGRTLGRALDSKAATGKVNRVQGTTYRITPEGMQFAEAVAGIGNAPPAPTPQLASTNGATPQSTQA